MISLNKSSFIFILLSGFFLTSCSGVGDSLRSINPLAEKEKILPGERRSLGGVKDPVAGLQNSSVSIPGAKNFDNWSVPGGNAAHNPGHVALNSAGGWQSRLGVANDRKGLRMSTTPIVSAGRVFTYDPEGNVTAGSLSNGGQIWRTALRPEGEKARSSGGGISAGNGFIYAATGYGQVAALNPSNGAIIWTKDLSTPALSAPTYADGKLFVVTQSDRLYAFSASDGTELWTFRGIPSSAGVLGSGSPAFSQGVVVVPYSSGELVALNVKDGKPKWVDAVTSGLKRSAVSSFKDVSGHPVITQGIVIATSVGGRTIAVSLSSGERLWEKNIGSHHTPISAGDILFMSDMEGRLVALSVKSGKIFWALSLPKGKKKKREIWTGPSLAGGYLHLVSNQGSWLRVNPSTGALLSQQSLSKASSVQPIAVGGKLLITANDGTIIAR